MVHALHEAWRVLVPQGILIDLRPYCVDVPLEILSKEGIESAGLVDMSPDIVDDQAADAAISAVVGEGIFNELMSDYFDFAYYWNSVEEMMVDWDEKWKDNTILPEEVVQQASILYQKHDARARLRVRIRMKLVKFGKQRLPAHT